MEPIVGFVEEPGVWTTRESIGEPRVRSFGDPGVVSVGKPVVGSVE